MPDRDPGTVRELARLLADPDMSKSVRCSLLKDFRKRNREAAETVDAYLVQRIDQAHEGLKTAHECMKKQKEEIRALTSPPFFPAVFVKTLKDRRAVVWHAGSTRVVEIHPDIDDSPLGIGDAVLLNSDRNVLLEASDELRSDVGDVAEFKSVIDSRIVLTNRDDQLIVEPAKGLKFDQLQEGDQIRFDPMHRIAYEKIEKRNSTDYFVNDLPDTDFSKVGGNRRQRRTLQKFLKRICFHSDIVGKYQLARQQSIIFHGPPGCGKTLMVKAVAAEMQRSLEQPFKLAIVQPAAWESPYVGITQSKIRACFASLRSEAEKGVVLVYFDEVEAIGRIRGGINGHHSDKFQAALLAEIDGFGCRGNVAIISSTNRKDLLDPALLERLSDIELQVPRPKSEDAREIFAVHLPESLPFSPNGSSATATRNQLIEHAISRLYAPNSANALNQIKFRDGSTKQVFSSDLISGRIIEQICRAACQSACDGEIAASQTGIMRADLDYAIDEALERMASTLSPLNARNYLSDLPRDVDIIDVTRLQHQGLTRSRYLSVS